VRYTRDAGEFDRAFAFIDATFAVALTLLVTTLEVDDVPSSFTSISALSDAVGAQFITFVIAFAVIATYWFANHRMVAKFVAIDTPTIVAHLLLIAAIVLLPFTTAFWRSRRRGPSPANRADGCQHRRSVGTPHAGLPAAVAFSTTRRPRASGARW